MCGVFEVLFQSDVSGRDIDHLQTHCGGRTQCQVQCSSAIPIYQDHVTIHSHYDSLVFKIRSRLDKHIKKINKSVPLSPNLSLEQHGYLQKFVNRLTYSNKRITKSKGKYNVSNVVFISSFIS
jgi:hypothetical protein